jgi:hypothetical protein
VPEHRQREETPRHGAGELVVPEGHHPQLAAVADVGRDLPRDGVVPERQLPQRGEVPDRARRYRPGQPLPGQSQLHDAGPGLGLRARDAAPPARRRRCGVPREDAPAVQRDPERQQRRAVPRQVLRRAPGQRGGEQQRGRHEHGRHAGTADRPPRPRHRRHRTAASKLYGPRTKNEQRCEWQLITNQLSSRPGAWNKRTATAAAQEHVAVRGCHCQQGSRSFGGSLAFISGGGGTGGADAVGPEV